MGKSEWDDYAPDWDDNPQVGAYAAQAFEELENVLNLDGQRVFDFGCGTGLLSEKISARAKEVVALDSSTKMIEVLAQKNLSKVVALADLLTTQAIKKHPSLQQPFDLIVASSVCAFLPDYPGTLNLLKGMLSKGGYFVQWDWLTTGEENATGFSPSGLHTALEDAGFQDVTITTPFEIEGMRVVMAVACVESQ